MLHQASLNHQGGHRCWQLYDNYCVQAKTEFEFFDVVDITPQDFFYLGREYNKDDKYMLDMFNSLSADSKRTIVDLMKKLK